MRRPISSLNPFFYYVIVKLRRLDKYIKWQRERKIIAKTISKDKLDYRVFKHQSVLIRRLGESDLTLQYNKVENLKIAVNKLNGIIIRPGEKFSFWYLVGCPTKKKGYLDGMLLSDGEAMAGLGGGLCQIANLIHWLCLHSPLTVAERHHHSYDPFPDHGRVVPFGSGASVFYNYMDYQFINTTEYTFQLLFWFDEKCINGDLRVNIELPYKYHVFEKDHQFVKTGDSFYRRNELWREKYYKKGSGEAFETELLQKNNALVKYVPEEYVEL
ncbi:MAG: VanW family protein [Oscillospiraceae bacterium]|nr:VanW family protein [Oscillospiraceae bacterium]